ncbi:MAG: type III-A CRISPR-associated RAMP protein Csm3 [Candidatus Caldarchaeum sp.]
MTAIAKPLLGKVILQGVIRTLTGLHIGTSKEVLEIGGLDNLIVREPVTQEPYIPGSSLKGKLRSLLEKKVAPEQFSSNPSGFFKRNIGRSAYPIYIHVCDNKESAANCSVCRLFGSSAAQDEAGSNFPSRLRVRDAFLTTYTKTKLEAAETDLLYAELKFENALDRITAAAHPRPIERVPPRSDFAFEIVYDVESQADVQPDLENLLLTMSLLEDDALGGSGSRGSGKVKFFVYLLEGKKAEAYRQEQANLVKKAIDKRLDQQAPDVESTVERLPTLEVVKAKVQEIARFFQAVSG